MAIRLRFDSENKPRDPILILTDRVGNRFGQLQAVNIRLTDAFNDASELSFRVYKYDNGKVNPLWDEITSLKLVYCKEWDMFFELTVTISDGNDQYKSCTGTSLGAAELGQIMLYGIQINTEDDIARDNYVVTVFYNPDNPDGSLLHRISEKAPHWQFGYVSPTLTQIQRMFEFNSQSLYDSLQEISEEIGCYFDFKDGMGEDGKPMRVIDVYDLQSYCYDCQKRGYFYSMKCPHCGSEHIERGYGKQTDILISPENLTDNIEFTTDVGSIKNCFRVEAGDDLMTSAIRTANPNGSQYIWYFTDEMRKAMSHELQKALSDYDEKYKEITNNIVLDIPKQTYADYLILYEKYKEMYAKYYEDEGRTLVQIENGKVNFSELINILYTEIDFELFLQSAMMPSPKLQDTTAKDEAAKINKTTFSQIAVSNLRAASSSTVDNYALQLAKSIIDTRYQIKVNTSSYRDYMWVGTFKLTAYADETDTIVTDEISAPVTDDLTVFYQQKIDNTISKKVIEIADAPSLFKAELDVFKEEIKKYGLTPLDTFLKCGNVVLTMLIDNGIAEENEQDSAKKLVYDKIYMPYLQKVREIEAEMTVRQHEIEVLSGVEDEDGNIIEDGLRGYIEKLIGSLNDQLNFHDNLGDDCWKELACHVREDEYSNDNFISDGLTNAEIVDNANRFFEEAYKEITKSASRQHSITATLYNLLALPEFSSIVHYFQTGSWMSCKVDDKIYHLRLLSYEVNYDDLSRLNVTFSEVSDGGSQYTDLESVIQQARQMASSYSAVTRQASKAEDSRKIIDNFVNNGLDLTNTKIVDNARSQSFITDSTGILGRRRTDLGDGFEPSQIRLINNGLYYTNDEWEHVKAGLGEFRFYNPKTGQYENAYGVIADKLVGNIILSQEVGIYNSEGSASMTFDNNGLRLDTSRGSTGDGNYPNIFTVSKDGKPQMWINSDGNLVIDATSTMIFGGGTYNDTLLSQTQVVNDLNNKFNQYFRFDNERGLIIGDQDNPVKLILNNQKVYFTANGAINSELASFDTGGLVADRITANESISLDPWLFSREADNTLDLMNMLNDFEDDEVNEGLCL